MFRWNDWADGAALRVIGHNTGSVADLRDVARAVAAARIQPVVDRVFPFAEAAAADRLLSAGGQHFGKIAIAHEAR
jgi:NADPH:quinone reductase-like Zn-dependent oxidoreductase